MYFIYTEDDAELDEIIDFGLSQGVREVWILPLSVSSCLPSPLRSQ